MKQLDTKQQDIRQPITGSYQAEDCQFLLSPIEASYTDIATKERLIQSGQKHYSEMISYESVPSSTYTELFHALTLKYKARLAAEILCLSRSISQQKSGLVTIVSLARAGTPFGALLNRALKTVYQADSVHYSISIIRDRGIDTNALKYILREAKRPASSIIFVDTWTAKGVITNELKQAIYTWNQTEDEYLSDDLYVVSDIGGTADYAATYDDYAIPSGIMNATVSGLQSRSILNEQIGTDDFHGSVYYEHLKAHDLSQWFLDEISEQFSQVKPADQPNIDRETRYQQSQQWIKHWMKEFEISDVNHIKPGVAEATRVMLRRVPACLILKNSSDPDVAHLRLLAEEKSVPILDRPTMPFKAVAFIKALY